MSDRPVIPPSNNPPQPDAAPGAGNVTPITTPAMPKLPDDTPPGTAPEAAKANVEPVEAAPEIEPAPAPRNQKRRRARRQAQKAAQEPPKIVEVAPIAPPAHMRRRHWGLLLTFLLMVAAPTLVSGWYLWTVAKPQYASTVGFTVRQEESGGATDLLGGFASSLGSTGTQKDADILYEYIRSQDLVGRIETKLSLTEHYSASWSTDPAYSLWPDATIEDLTRYWSRVAQISYDAATGLIELRVLAFEPEMAQAIANGILEEGQRLINDLNAQARLDTIRYAQVDLEDALVRLKDAREAMAVFRSQSQIVDPQTDIQGRMGVVNTLQQQLAAALIERDLLAERTNASDPRVTQAERRIDVIRARIAEERLNISSGSDTGTGDDYPTLLGEYEGLIVDREYAEESYRAALAALDVARANANRQSRYLAAYVAPTLPQTAEYPRRFLTIGLIALFSFLAWAILSLVYYSIRDSR